MTAATLAPARVGQITAIEQSRAAAEVQARVLVAMQFPRSTVAATREMEQVCRLPTLAEQAFYEFPRGKEKVKGPSIYLAAELARCWGNLDYGVWELARDDQRGQSEMLAFAWDLQTNTRVASGFIVPHKRDTKEGPTALDAMRDIYENNANNGARRVREAIFRILPRWYLDKAVDLCRQTLRDGGGTPLAERITAMVRGFEALGVTEHDIARRLDRPSSRWTEQDIADLGITYRSMQRGEISRDEAFPGARVTAEEITANAARVPEPTPSPAPGPAPAETPVATAPAGQPPADSPPVTTPPRPAMDSNERRNRNRLHAVLGGPGIDLNAAKKRDDKLSVLSDLASRPVDSSDDLTADEVQRAVDLLVAISRGDEADRPLAIAEHVEAGRKLRAAAQAELPKEN